MSFSHSFSEDFYYQEGWETKTRHPTSVAQALFSMPKKKWNRMCRDVFGVKGDLIDVETVMDKIRETNTCTDLSVPVEVWIDEEGYYTVQVH